MCPGAPVKVDIPCKVVERWPTTFSGVKRKLEFSRSLDVEDYTTLEDDGLNCNKKAS